MTEESYRDIKPQNVLLKGSNIYFADFDVSVQRLHGKISGSFRSAHPGTQEYSAPEQDEDQDSYVGRAADIFSLGCIFADLSVLIRGGSVKKFRKDRSSRPTPRWSTGRDYSFHGNKSQAIGFIEKLWQTKMEEKKLLTLIASMLNTQNNRSKIRSVMYH
jgi:serine/threonine protein kinase